MKNRLAVISCLCSFAALALCSGQVIQSCRYAVELCLSLILPSLFPFFVLSVLLNRLGLPGYLGRLLTPLASRVYGVTGAGASALLIGLTGGYPLGAAYIADMERSGAITAREGERLLAFCNNSNPVFLVSVLGSGVFGSVRVGVWLWLIHIFSALVTGILFRGGGRSAGRQHPARDFPCRSVSFSSAFVKAVRSAAAGMLSVCAFVVLFYVLASPLAALGGRLGTALVGIVELFSLTPLLTPDRFGLILAAGCAGWGGLSVLCQTASVLDGSGLRFRNCFWGKLTQGLLSALLAAVLSGYILP